MRTKREIGTLCGAWSYLEYITENSMWGILDLNENTAKLIAWKKSTVDKWATIMEFAKQKHDGEDLESLYKINKEIKIVAKDRNIIIHGLVHASMFLPDEVRAKEIGQTVVIKDMYPIGRPPCWTIFQGEGKGRNFPISHSAVVIVRENIQNIMARVEAFNAKHKYGGGTIMKSDVEKDWPKPL